MAIHRRRPIAVLNLRKLQILGNFVIKMRAIALNMTNNSSIFPSPTPTLLVFSAHINDLEETETITKTREVGSVERRNTKYIIVLEDAYSLMSYVQMLADKTDTELEAMQIIDASGFDLKKQGSRVKPDLDAKNTKVSGVVQLIAKSAGKDCPSVWEISDDTINWTYLDTTKKASIKVFGLMPGSTKYFRHRSVKTKGKTGWSQIVSIIVT